MGTTTTFSLILSKELEVTPVFPNFVTVTQTGSTFTFTLPYGESLVGTLSGEGFIINVVDYVQAHYGSCIFEAEGTYSSSISSQTNYSPDPKQLIFSSVSLDVFATAK
jgi:hypothetical protein